MAKKFDFGPDKPHSGFFGKLYLTKKQRKGLLKWTLYGLVLLVLSLLQDVMLCHVRLFGATTDLIPCGIFLICLIEGSERGSVFALCASCVYLFSGFSPGPACIVFITAIGVGICLFRQGYLQQGFRATLLCLGLAVVAYELAVFVMGLVLGLTHFGRIGGFGITAVLSFIAVPVLYPVVQAIQNLGGNPWKE